MYRSSSGSSVMSIGRPYYCIFYCTFVADTMPGFHVIVAAMAGEDKKMTEVLSTCSRGHVETFYRKGPIAGFDFPMDNMSQCPGIREMDYDGMLAIVSANGNSNYG